MKELDLFSVPLEGRTLIEAGAGTGKTWSITGIFLRLLLEQRLNLSQILVVTFTNPASEELRLRIQERIKSLYQALAGGEMGDSLTRAMAERFKDHPDAIRILMDAVRNFDQASIFTIHGFCSRLLREFAFETGSSFTAEVITDHSRLVREVCEDYWRIQLYSSPVEFAGYCMDRLNGPKGFSDLFLRNQWGTVRILPGVSDTPLTHLDQFRDQLTKLKEAWPDSKNEIRSILKTAGLKKPRYDEKKNDLVIEKMDDFLDLYSPGFPVFEEFDRLTPRWIQEAILNPGTISPHPFLDLCREFYEIG
ncbi:MAG: UvrD-helicase domain-containing protein, partial [Thermodesulfobacteriota bacterium]